MKRPHRHLLRVEAPPEAFAGLLAAVRGAGLRAGWLELAASGPLPPSLEVAAAAGVMRAVSAGGGRSVVVKPLVGEPVLDDLLREHFRGCALVLISGEAAAPCLAAEGAGWRVAAEGVTSLRFTTAELVARLRRPHPW